MEFLENASKKNSFFLHFCGWMKYRQEYCTKVGSADWREAIAARIRPRRIGAGLPQAGVWHRAQKPGAVPRVIAAQPLARILACRTDWRSRIHEPRNDFPKDTTCRKGIGLLGTKNCPVGEKYFSSWRKIFLQLGK